LGWYRVLSKRLRQRMHTRLCADSRCPLASTARSRWRSSLLRLPWMRPDLFLVVQDGLRHGLGEQLLDALGVTRAVLQGRARTDLLSGTPRRLQQPVPHRGPPGKCTRPTRRCCHPPCRGCGHRIARTGSRRQVPHVARSRQRRESPPRGPGQSAQAARIHGRCSRQQP
jgi:hypothetical protein